MSTEEDRLQGMQSAELVPARTARAGLFEAAHLPALVARASDATRTAFVEFFAARIRNRNTRAAYARAVGDFLAWCDTRGVLELGAVTPVVVSAYLECHPGAPPTVKQHLAALRMLFDWLVVRQVLAVNPASVVRGPSHVVDRGKTPVLTPREMAQLFDAIPTSSPVGLRDRAIIGVMAYSFARVSAVIGMRVEHYYPERERWWFRFREKRGKRHEVPAHTAAQLFVNAYLDAAGIAGEKGTPLFRSWSAAEKQFTVQGLARENVAELVKRRVRQAGLPASISCHSFRATGITAYLEGGGTLEKAQQIAAHASPRTTKLYDRTRDELTASEIERIHYF
jgi:integrase/recombinase XerD